MMKDSIPTNNVDEHLDESPPKKQRNEVRALSMLDLPNDVVQNKLLKYLTNSDLGRMRRVSKFMKSDWIEIQTHSRGRGVVSRQLIDDVELSGSTALEWLEFWNSARSMVSCGESHGAHICKNQGVLVWSEGRPRSPLPTFSDSRVVSVSCGYRHTLILTDDGSVYALGQNTSGELGLGDTIDRSTPTKIQFDEPIDVAVGGKRCSAFLSKKSNRVYVCGSLNVSLDLNIEDQIMTHPCAISLAELLPSERIEKICLGASHLLAVSNFNRLFSAGEGSESQLGRVTNGQVSLERTLRVIEFPESPIASGEKVAIVQVSAGEAHNLVLFGDGSVYAFGRSNFGELGIPQFVASPAPQRVPHLSRAVAIACGHKHSLVLCAATNKIVAFGMSVFGQLGYRPSFWSSSYARDSPFPRIRSASESSTSSSSSSNAAIRGSAFVKYLAGGSRFSAVGTADGEELYMCGKSSLCAGAGGDIKSGDELVQTFTAVPL